jgi:hypothetical protein
VAWTVGPMLIRVFFGFREGLSPVTFLAMGLSVGLYLAAMIIAQALLGRGLHAWTTAGWLVGLAGTVVGTAFPGSAVDRATTGFLSGAVAAACAFAVLLTVALRRWPAPDATGGSATERQTPFSTNPVL